MDSYDRMTYVSAVMIALIAFIHLPAVEADWYGAWRAWGVDGICRLGVPWFFFASGVYFARHIGEGGGWYGREIRKRVGGLLVPYFILNLIWFPCMLALNWIGTRYFAYPANVTLSLGWIVKGLGFSPVDWPIVVPTWFLRALFVVAVLCGAVWKVLRFNRISALAVTAVFWGIFAAQRLWLPQAAEFCLFGVNLQGLALFSSGVLCSSGLAPRTGATGNPVLRRMVWSVFILHAPLLTLVLIPFKAFGGLGAFANPLCYFGVWFGLLVSSALVGNLLRIDRIRSLCGGNAKSPSGSY